MPHIAVARSRLGDGFARQKARLARLIAAIELAIEVRRERRFLLGLDDRARKDLGLNGDAYAEAARPFWDLPLDRLRT
jgi:uncharacterized protein YjiS (DUF1127 family)